MLGREVGSSVFSLRQCQTGNFREIGDLAFQVGRLESDVAEALGLYHAALRIPDRIGRSFAAAPQSLPGPRPGPLGIVLRLARRILRLPKIHFDGKTAKFSRPSFLSFATQSGEKRTLREHSKSVEIDPKLPISLRPVPVA
jgi:hypothetical protein